MQIRKITNSPKHHFFGYYDLCPWNESGEEMCVLETTLFNKMPNGEEATICVVREDSKIYPIATTNSWNFQQGARLQWNNNQEVVFNNSQGCVRLNVKNRKKRQFLHHIYSLHPQKQVGITSDFLKLNRLRRGYGYPNSSVDDQGDIFLLNIDTGKSKKIIELKEVINFHLVPSSLGKKNWIHYPTFNKCGSRVAFLHRFNTGGDGMYSRLIVCNSDGSKMRVVLDSGMASHFTWKNDDEILIWGRLPNITSSFSKKSGTTEKIINLLRKPYYFLVSKNRTIKSILFEDSFLLINTKTGVIKKMNSDILKEDGHASFSSSGKLLLLDTYPHKHRSSIIVFNVENKKKKIIAELKSLPNNFSNNWDYSGLRCDLHPRWSKDCKKICFDSVDDGTRQVYVINDIFNVKK